MGALLTIAVRDFFRASLSLLLLLLLLLLQAGTHHANSLRISLHIQGKAEKGWLHEGYEQYRKRLGSSLELSTIWHKSNEAMEKAVMKETCPVILMDVLGDTMSSPRFSEHLFGLIEEGGTASASFVIGGADGLPQGLLAAKSFERMSFGPMTLTHSFARTLLAEQIYRAAEIRKGSGYHKE